MNVGDVRIKLIIETFQRLNYVDSIRAVIVQ